MNAALSGPSAARHAVDRAANAFALAEAWLFSDPMGELLCMLGQQTELPSRDSADWTGWLHLNEELPRWLDTLFSGPDAAIDGLSPERMELLRRTLETERAAATAFNF